MELLFSLAGSGSSPLMTVYLKSLLCFILGLPRQGLPGDEAFKMTNPLRRDPHSDLGDKQHSLVECLPIILEINDCEILRKLPFLDLGALICQIRVQAIFYNPNIFSF